MHAVAWRAVHADPCGTNFVPLPHTQKYTVPYIMHQCVISSYSMRITGTCLPTLCARR